MSASAPASFLDSLRQCRLLDSTQLDALSREPRLASVEPRALARELVKRGWLTTYQVNEIFLGRTSGLLLGSYVLLDKLGEGGMGAVFKARNWKLGRIVALKLIRKERLDNPAAVRRFQREVRAAAALSHPNIVHAHDADEIGGTHFLVMEYIEGATDLNQLVKQSGPLPVSKACDYVRQAALGLQHAFERGLVHRDIKPANLLLTADRSIVKLLDMGLARLDHGTEDDKSTTMTQEGAVMGTPDYIAPEQAMESHSVDIRADLYSLGCTLYCLLTGKVPFPGGSMMEKLLKHRLEEPKPVEQVRPGVPAGVAAVVRRLMAKKPEDRYQTPAEAALALAAVVSAGSEQVANGAADRTVADGRPSPAVTDPSMGTIASPFVALGTSDTVGSLDQRRQAVERRWLLYSLAGGLCVLIGATVVVLLASRQSGAPKRPARQENQQAISVSAPDKKPAKVDDAWLKRVAAMPAEQQVEAVAIKLKELNPGFDGKVKHEVIGGVVYSVQFVVDNVTDLSPLRALEGLVTLKCSGSGAGKSNLVDLSPLKGLKLRDLDCFYTQVVDLSPLAGLPLRLIRLLGSPVSDLSPLRNMSLSTLAFENSRVSDLSPLKGMPLTWLAFDGSPVADLSPLRGMPLTGLGCSRTRVSDLSPLKGMPLTALTCDFKPERDTAILRSIETLKMINHKPAAEFWKEVEAKQAAIDGWHKEVAAMPAERQVEAVSKKLQELNPGFDGKVTHKVADGMVTELHFHTDNVTDISPVRALSGLKSLSCGGSLAGKGKLVDLSPLRGMKLTYLSCSGTEVFDLSPLKGHPLAVLYCAYTKVSDLSPLEGMPLTLLECSSTQVSDLSPLRGMKLRLLLCGGTQVADLVPLQGMELTDLACVRTQIKDLSPLRGIPLKRLMCDFKPERDAEILRSIKTLEVINGKPVVEFWKDVDGALQGQGP